MNIAALHAHVRDVVRDTPPAATPQEGDADPGQLSAAERLALRSFRHHLVRVGGDPARLEPVGGTYYWMASPRPTVG